MERGGDDLMVIDAHAHVYDVLSGYGARGEFRPLGKGCGIWATGEKEQFFPEAYGDIGFRAETLLSLMEKNGVDHAVLLQGGNYGFHNDYVAEVAASYPERFTAVGTLDPYTLYAQQILEHFIVDYKFKALKFEISQNWGMTGYHPDLKLDNAVFAPIIERANQLSMTVVIDMGPMGTSGFDIKSLQNLVNRYSNITYVCTHCFFPCEDGKNKQRLDYMRQLGSDNFVFDISNLPGYCWSEPYVFLKDARRILGSERILWGSDLPGTLKKNTYAWRYCC